MSHSQDIKIRALPRADEKPKTSNPPPRWVVASIAVSTVLLSAVFFIQPRSVQVQAVKSQQADLTSIHVPGNEAVSKHLQDAAVKREMMVRALEMEQLKMREKVQGLNVPLPSEDPTRSYGLQLDQESSAERVYEDLNETLPRDYADLLPGDKINAKLANRRWLNDFERAERVQFVRNFIRAAYERGYEVSLNQDLVVVGVRKINRMQKVNIDQVIDRLAKQGM